MRTASALAQAALAARACRASYGLLVRTRRSHSKFPEILRRRTPNRISADRRCDTCGRRQDRPVRGRTAISANLRIGSGLLVIGPRRCIHGQIRSMTSDKPILSLPMAARPMQASVTCRPTCVTCQVNGAQRSKLPPCFSKHSCRSSQKFGAIGNFDLFLTTTCEIAFSYER
jgi:hypothetical protein